MRDRADRPERSPRTGWIGGRRGEILLLGPIFARLGSPSRPGRPGARSWWLATGEDGMAAFQALDALGPLPDETAPLCHPADQPAIRLKILIERIESFMRRRKLNRLIFAGVGPAAAAAALTCHARRTPGLWLRPADPTGLIGRLAWESGLERVIGACAPIVRRLDLPPAPDWRRLCGAAGRDERADAGHEADGLRPGADRVIWATLRREWGLMGTIGPMLRRLAAAAAARPGIDFVVLSNLNATLERPLAALRRDTPNLLIAPPLPVGVYMDLLESSSGVLTDSPMIAADGLGLGRPVAALGEIESAEAPADPLARPMTPRSVGGGELSAWIDAAPGLPRAPAFADPALADPARWSEELAGAIDKWITADNTD